MKAVFRRELLSLFRGITGWLVAAFVLLGYGIAIWLCTAAEMEFGYVMTYAMAAFAVIVPLYASRGFADDRLSGMDRLFFCLPIRPCQVVFGKYLAMCVPFLGGMALACAYPLLAGPLLVTSIGRAYAGMALYTLCGLALIGLSLYLSSLTGSRLINALIALACLAVAYFIRPIAAFLLSGNLATLMTLLIVAAVFAYVGHRMLGGVTGALVCALVAEVVALFFFSGNADLLAAFWSAAQRAIGVFYGFSGYMAGLFDVGTVAYYLAILALALLFATQRYTTKRLDGRRSAK